MPDAHGVVNQPSTLLFCEVCLRRSFVYFQEFDIDPNSDSDQVDELLALCVKQATQAQEGAEQNAT